MSGDKVDITCSLNGVLTNPMQHPVPVTPEQMACSAKEAVEAGASIMHIHFRRQEEGMGHFPSWEPDVAAEIVEAIREACPGVIINQTTARPVHEAGYYLGPTASAQAATFATLLKALEVALPLDPGRIELHCANELLVRQVTGQAAPGGDDELDLYEQSLGALLRLDSWQIRATEPAEVQRANDLAGHALHQAEDVHDLHVDDSTVRHRREHTGVPQWTVELLEDPGADCPARCVSGKRYAFGPDTPAGFCVHAAIVAMTDGPLTWPDPDQRRMTTSCPHCDTPLRISLAHDDAD